MGSQSINEDMKYFSPVPLLASESNLNLVLNSRAGARKMPHKRQPLRWAKGGRLFQHRKTYCSCWSIIWDFLRILLQHFRLIRLGWDAGAWSIRKELSEAHVAEEI